MRGADDVWLTVFTRQPPTWPAPDGLTALRDDEVLMRTALEPGPADPRVVVMADGPVARAAVVLDGVEAASGVVAIVGGDAVVDPVVTSPEHRRRGLGAPP